MIDDTQFLVELRQQVRRHSVAAHLVDTLAFSEVVAERLQEEPAFGEMIGTEFMATGSGGKQLKVHGYSEIDASDGSMSLMIAKWSDDEEPSTLSTTDVTRYSMLLANLVSEARERDLASRIPESNKTAYDLAGLLQDKNRKLARIRLHLISNQILSQRFKDEILDTVAGVPVERFIWDLTRLKTVFAGAAERDPLEINLREFHCDGIQCIEAATTENLRSWLCVIDGQLLADLFERHGSRLLEGNVRSFLGMKGGVNKGIRATIQDSPELFFAYNNGIAATAAEVNVEELDGRPMITGLRDLQIVNGGQTTASILSARKKDKLSLSGVTLQMKLTQVASGQVHDLVPKIAKYANTQNKVAVADFFANHPFHLKIEEISRRLHVPAKSSDRVQRKWFYERSRGQYQNERLYLSTARKTGFDLEYPPEQVITKTDVAKFDSSWNLHPDWVSQGAQKNFMKFAENFEGKGKDGDLSETEYWERISPTYGEDYFKTMVAVAIIWKATEAIVSGARDSWYRGDYRAPIVAYTLAKLFQTIRSTENELNWLRAWSTQDTDPVLRQSLTDAAILVQDALLAPPAGYTNVGEWAKKSDCWKRIQDLPLVLAEEMAVWYLDKKESVRLRQDAHKQGKIDDDIAIQGKILALTTSGYWTSLLAWVDISRHLTDDQTSLVRRASTVGGFTKIARPADRKLLLELRDRCEQEGFRSGSLGGHRS